tara:strand:+ start:35 stop:487 length:453 start_codon:yes stop_codon:yes gene_type:complete
MKKLLAIIVLGLLFNFQAKAKISLGSEKLLITSFPSEANCELKNDKGTWNVVTPATIKIKRSKKPLEVSCIKNDFKKVETFDFKTSKIIDSRVKDDAIDVGISTILNDPIGVVLEGAEGALNIARNSFGSYGTTRNANGIATINLILKSE